MMRFTQVCVHFYSPCELVSPPARKLDLTKQTAWSPGVICIPLKSLLLIERKHKNETGGFPRLEHISLSPKPCWPNSSISRYRVHKHPCSYKDQVIVQRFQRVMLAGSWWESSEELIFQVKILVCCPNLSPGCWQPQS